MFSRFDPEARIAVMQATEEARELGHSEVGPDHVLLGMLSNMRGSTFALLTEHGLRLDSAREVVVAQRAALAETQPSPTGTPDSDVSDVYVPTIPAAATGTPRITLPPTDTLGAPQDPGNPGFSLMLTLLALAALVLVIGFVTPVPISVRERDRR